MVFRESLYYFPITLYPPPAPRRIIRETVKGGLIVWKPRRDPGFFGGAHRGSQRWPPGDAARNEVCRFERKARRGPARRQRDEGAPGRIGGPLRRPRPGEQYAIDLTLRPPPVQPHPPASSPKRP